MRYQQSPYIRIFLNRGCLEAHEASKTYVQNFKMTRHAVYLNNSKTDLIDHICRVYEKYWQKDFA